MEVLLDQENRAAEVSFRRNPIAWFRNLHPGGNFWWFFTAAFFFDAGFAVYFFLFNLYLLDFHFNERAIGLVNSALTLGSVLGTLPVGALGRKIGLRPLLLFCFAAAPLVGLARAMWMWEPAQIGLAFLAGLVMCNWGVCFLPTVAALTSEKNRTSAISLIFSVGIGTSAVGGLICGYLPRWLRAAGMGMSPVEVKRLILIVSCGIAAVGGAAVLRLRIPLRAETGEQKIAPERMTWLRDLRLSPFLRRFLLCMSLWTALLAAFTPFATVYLSRDLHMPFERIGMVFSIAQVVQFGAGLLIPILVRTVGMVNGIVVTQVGTAVTLALLALVGHEPWAAVLYVTFSAAQWMSAPGLYNVLMNETPEAERSTASAMTMFCNALAGSAATAGAGILFTRFGYKPVLLGIAGFAGVTAVLCRTLMGPRENRGPAQSPLVTTTVTD